MWANDQKLMESSKRLSDHSGLMQNHSSKRIAIIQSCYIPWKGFFDLIGRCDEYVILDGAQYVKGHWHNRNRIMAASGPLWLTIPVATAGRLAQPIEAVETAGKWAEMHWKTLSQVYRKAPYFELLAPRLSSWYQVAAGLRRLTETNEFFLRAIAELLALPVTIVRDRSFRSDEERTQRLVRICAEAKADIYLSGPSAQAYLDETAFKRAGIRVEWMSYGPYPEYPQQRAPFQHAVSILDLLFQLGPEAAASQLRNARRMSREPVGE